MFRLICINSSSTLLGGRTSMRQRMRESAARTARLEVLNRETRALLAARPTRHVSTPATIEPESNVTDRDPEPPRQRAPWGIAWRAPQPEVTDGDED